MTMMKKRTRNSAHVFLVFHRNKSIRSLTDGRGGVEDRFLDEMECVLVSGSVVGHREVRRRDEGKSYIIKPEGNRDAPLCSAVARK